MDDETIEELFGSEDDETLVDDAMLAVGDDTVVTSAVPEHVESPWSDRLIRSAVFYAVGTA